MRLAVAARKVCDSLEILATLELDESEAPTVANSWRRLLAQDAQALLSAAIEKTEPPTAPHWPTLPDVADDDDRDVLLAAFAIPAEDLIDDDGAFCDTRVIAAYRLRLRELQEACDPIMRLVSERPPSVFTAVSAVRDLATTKSPFVTLWGAIDIRSRILDAFNADPVHTRTVLADAAQEGDKEWVTFLRLRECLRRAEAARARAAGTEREYAISILEAYKHMAEGHTRRWVGVLLRLGGLEGPVPTVGGLAEPVLGRLGELGSHIEAALRPALRNAEAHDDFTFDEETGLLVVGDATFHPDEILARLTELDILQRALIVGRLAAFADQPELGSAPRRASDSSAMNFARQRFGHAGQHVRSFVRDRDRLDLVIDDLGSEACNPCFVALAQAAQALPTVRRFTVRIPSRDDPVIDITSSVLHENWGVFELAVKDFPDALPQVTFLPSLTWARLACESVDETARAAAWMALNEATHAILDANAAPVEFQRLPARFGVVIAATTSTIRLLPEGRHLDDLIRARRITLATANVLARDPHGLATTVLTDRIFGLRDRLGGPVAVLPTLDPTPLREGSYPHAVS